FQSGRDLWRLSRSALGRPDVLHALDRPTTGATLAALETTPDGQAFLADLRGYLETWGRRGDKLGVGYPSWIEDPTPALKQLRDYAAQPDRDVEAEFAGSAEARERAIAEARARLAGYPAGVRG